MKRRSAIILVLVLLALVALFVGYKEYNRPPATAAQLKASIKIEASQLALDYAQNEAAANKNYLGKVIEVAGQVIEKEGLNILIGDATSQTNVSCSMDASQAQKLNSVQAGTSVKVRGVCTGYLTDVELDRCVFVN